MAVNLYIVVPTIAVAVALLLWLIYRNLKDERKFERDINAKDEIPAVKEEKEKEGM